jgi:hypothetical protein
MAAPLTKEEAQAFLERMRLMGERPPLPASGAEALAQFSSLIAAAYYFGWVDDLRRDEDRVRQLWVRLKTRES